MGHCPLPSAAARREAFCVLPAMVWRSSRRGAERHTFNAGKDGSGWGLAEATLKFVDGKVPVAKMSRPGS